MSPLAWTMTKLVRAYQMVLSPLLGPNCRFQPTCSAYALQAIKRHGGIRGSWLAVRRIVRCHPWGGSGFDPVPERNDGGCGRACNDSKDGESKTGS